MCTAGVAYLIPSDTNDLIALVSRSGSTPPSFDDVEVIRAPLIRCTSETERQCESGPPQLGGPLSALSGWTGVEDFVPPNPAPDDMRLVRSDRLAELPGGSPVRCPRHLHDGAPTFWNTDALYGLDPEAGSKLPCCYIRNEPVLDDVLEALLLIWGELLEVALEVGSCFERWQ